MNLAELTNGKTRLVLGNNAGGASPEPFPKAELKKRQFITISRKIINCVTLDTDDVPKEFKELGVIDAGSPGKRYTKSDLISELTDSEFLGYRWNWMGFVTRPLEFSLDESSVKVSKNKTYEIRINDLPQVTLRTFSLSYTMNGVVEFGGRLWVDSEIEEYDSLERWSLETNPKLRKREAQTIRIF